MLETSLDLFLLHILFHYVITSEFCHSFVNCLFNIWTHCILEGSVEMFDRWTKFQVLSRTGFFLSGASSLFAKCSAIRIR